MADFSCYISIVNQTRQTLTLNSYGNSFGYWKVTPQDRSGPNTTMDFQLADKSGPGGSTGWVRFAASPGVIFDMSFDDPYGEGDNKCKITMSGQATGHYRVNFEAKSGSGNWQRNVCPPGGHPLHVRFLISAPMPRLPSDAEFASLVKDFPSLKRSSVVVLAEKSDIYNCIAWSLGMSYTWVNPPARIDDFAELYETAADSVHVGEPRDLAWCANGNWQVVAPESPSATIDGWGNTSIRMKHASRQILSADFATAVWTSKIGEDLMITHDRDGLVSQSYGRVLTSFFPDPHSPDLKAELESRHVEMTAPEFFTDRDREILAQALAGVAPSSRRAFEALADAWLKAVRERLRFSSDTRDAADLPEFAALVALGSEVLPLVVERLCKSPRTEFRFAVLYDALQHEPALKVSYAPGDPHRFEGEPARAARSAKLWLSSLS